MSSQKSPVNLVGLVEDTLVDSWRKDGVGS